MAKSEACEVFLEQEIKAGLEQDKNPHQIGKELSAWLQEKMDVHIKPNAVRMRVFRIQEDCTNVQHPTPRNQKNLETTKRLLRRCQKLLGPVEMKEKDRYHAKSMLEHIIKMLEGYEKEEEKT